MMTTSLVINPELRRKAIKKIPYQSLLKSARESASFRGHVLTMYSHTVYSSESDGKVKFSVVSTAYCQHCSKMLIVRSHPLPNQVDISGEVVAQNCPNVKTTENTANAETTADSANFENSES